MMTGDRSLPRRTAFLVSMPLCSKFSASMVQSPAITSLDILVASCSETSIHGLSFSMLTPGVYSRTSPWTMSVMQR
ncbi:hypothetical protein ARMSODRAFT_64409 [Armillaria solidipes]|uniref:Uncharacterized protein n=1 Tax=Armillaria solidipes TaxID=1076256 RepID=A0A2H3BYJ9_9AGAR|nr:hypothetical protein ARMSODRAFT_64409 [Armillaria solidipes]